jgi:hypothetical protein
MHRLTFHLLFAIVAASVHAEPQNAADDLLFPVNPPRKAKDPALDYLVKSPPPSNSFAKDGFSMNVSSIKAAPTEPIVYTIQFDYKGTETIDSSAISAFVHTYNQESDGSFSIAEVRPVPRWLSPPVNFAEPEQLEVTVQRSEGSIYGVVAALYYQGMLVTAKSEPDDLIQRFPPPQSR